MIKPSADQIGRDFGFLKKLYHKSYEGKTMAMH